MNYIKITSSIITSLTLSLSMASASAPMQQEQQRAMDVYGCDGLVRVDKKHPAVIQAKVKEFLIGSLNHLLTKNPELKTHRLESLDLTLNQVEEITNKVSRRVYALSSIAGSLNCPVLYIEDDIATYLFKDTYCGLEVIQTLKGVYGIKPKHIGNYSSCGGEADHFVIDLFHDLEDF